MNILCLLQVFTVFIDCVKIKWIGYWKKPIECTDNFEFFSSLYAHDSRIWTSIHSTRIWISILEISTVHEYEFQHEYDFPYTQQEYMLITNMNFYTSTRVYIYAHHEYEFLYILSTAHEYEFLYVLSYNISKFY